MMIQTYYPHVGGAERQLANVARLLRQQGVQIRVFTRQLPATTRFEIIDDIEVCRLPTPGPKAIASLSFTLGVLPLLRQFRPHVIHAHELLSPTTTAVFAKRLYGMPVVAKVLSGGKLGDIDKLQSRFMGPRRLAAFRNYVDVFISVSREIDTELATLGIPSHKRSLIPNGVDTKKFCNIGDAEKKTLRSELQLLGEPVVTFIGRLAPEKCIDQLISVWPAVRQVHHEALLLIVGTGEERRSLEEQAGPGVSLLGDIDNVAPYLQATDLFVLPSAREGLSNALLEAMSTGLPSVATNVGGALDLIEDGLNGYLIPPNKPERLQEAVIALLNSSEKRKTMGSQARLRVIQEYDLSTVTGRLLDLYGQVAVPEGES